MQRSASPSSSWRDIEVAAGGDASDSSLASLIIDGVNHGGARSVCVLDTNTLLHALPLLCSIWELLLQTAHQSFLYNAAPPPFTIVIPHDVLEELDKLKLRRSSISQKSRAAARWILSTVKSSHRSHTDEMEYSSMTLPLNRRPILVQTATQALELQTTSIANTVDETLCNLCAQLEKQTRLPVMFCSNDVIARTRAESQGVKTFDLEAILDYVARRRTAILDASLSDNDNRSRHDPSRQQHSQQAYTDADEEATKEAAATLLEQWAEQVHGSQGEQDLAMIPIDVDRPALQGHARAASTTALQPHAQAADTPTQELNPHIDWHVLSPPAQRAQSHTYSPSQSPPRRATRRNTTYTHSAPKTNAPTEVYLSYYQRKQIELREKEQREAMMVLDDD